jgi:hypothetical protein
MAAIRPYAEDGAFAEDISSRPGLQIGLFRIHMSYDEEVATLGCGVLTIEPGGGPVSEFGVGGSSLGRKSGNQESGRWILDLWRELSDRDAGNPVREDAVGLQRCDDVLAAEFSTW